MSLKFEAYVFDLDGTLVQTPNNYPYNITKATLEACGATRPEYHEAEEFWFCPVERNNFIKEKFKVCPTIFWKEFNRLDEAHLIQCEECNIPYVFAYSDIYALMELKKLGAKLGLVTGCAAYTIEHKLKQIPVTFDSIVVANEALYAPKPNPMGLLECLEKLQAVPERACYIGDLVVDIQMAQNTKVFSIRINRDRVKFPGEVKPDVTIRSLTELLQ